ncbi:unnamed protein product [Lupinus luteus]|uniref:Uncharacterized protein n=1 Tax=Lupinus luteus TaxID=3873 RepID=A0AAV1XG52_LUPLU
MGIPQSDGEWKGRYILFLQIALVSITYIGNAHDKFSHLLSLQTHSKVPKFQYSMIESSSSLEQKIIYLTS